MKKIAVLIVFLTTGLIGLIAQEAVPDKFLGCKWGEKIEKAQKELRKGPYKVLPQSNSSILEVEEPTWQEIQFQLGWLYFEEERFHAIDYLALFSQEADMFKIYSDFKQYTEQLFLKGEETGNPDILQYTIPGKKTTLSVNCFKQNIEGEDVYIMQVRFAENKKAKE